MNIINPNEIGVKISTLITESKKFFYAVTPYLNISTWEKIVLSLKNAEKRGVEIVFFVREIKASDKEVLDLLNIEFYVIHNLHTKLYFNENQMIVSSMNLYEYSDLHSIDIALKIEKGSNYNEIHDYFIKYIDSQKISIENTSPKELNELHNFLSDRCKHAKIALTNTYIFSKNLIPIFHIFIDNITLGMKLPYKNPKIEVITEITAYLKASLCYEVQLDLYYTGVNKTGNKYARWNINITDLAYYQILELIDDLNVKCFDFSQERINESLKKYKI